MLRVAAIHSSMRCSQKPPDGWVKMFKSHIAPACQESISKIEHCSQDAEADRLSQRVGDGNAFLHLRVGTKTAVCWVSCFSFANKGEDTP